MLPLSLQGQMVRLFFLYGFCVFFCFALKVQDDHQYTVEDEKEIEKEIDEIERKIKAVSDVKNYT